MTPQLKPGCLAEIIRDDVCPGNTGRFVTCVRLATLADLRGYVIDVVSDPVWRIEAEGLHLDNGQESDWHLAYQSALRPISDPDTYTSRDSVIDLTIEKSEAAARQLGLVV
jgi:hypothetical protein